MKKLFVLFLLASFKISVCNSQKIFPTNCNTPTCEEPGDPGLNSTPNNQLIVLYTEAKKKINLTFNNFLSTEVNIKLINSSGTCLTNRMLKINKSVIDVNLKLLKETAGIYTVMVTSSDRIYTADLALR